MVITIGNGCQKLFTYYTVLCLRIIENPTSKWVVSEVVYKGHT
jgi:hypothetical protein